jgi:hypothetical protein
MSTATAERTEVGMAGGAEFGLADFAERMNERFDRIDERFDRVDEKFDRVDERFDRVDLDIHELKGRLDRTEVKSDRQFEVVGGRIDRLGEGLVNAAIILSGGIVACFAATIVLIATQL